MTTRRSTRLRASETNEADEGPHESARQTKRARIAAATAQHEPHAADESGDWRFGWLSPEKRAAWDEFMAAQFFLYQPHELYDVFDLAKHLSPANPLDAFVETIGVRLTGPFDLLAQPTNSVQTALPLYLHGRFFHDPPELVTFAVDTSSRTGAHWAFHRDSPQEPPMFIAHTDDASVCRFEFVTRRIVDVLLERLVDAAKTGKEQSEVQRQLSLLRTFISASSSTPTAVQSERVKNQTAKSLSGLGIAVPYNTKKRQGFRELPITGDDLRDVLQQTVDGDAGAKKKLSGLITRATIANDECDFGTSLLLGLDLFTFGSALQKEALQLLRVAYMLLGRKAFSSVVGNHAKHRSASSEPLAALSTDPSASSAVPLP